jgi:hypothetical protein
MCEMAGSDRDPSALLIDRLLGDADFRARFRRDAAGALRDAGVEGQPDELARTAGKAMETLEIRESRSSLAGVMLAGAIEALAVSGLAHHAEAASASVTPARASSVDELPNEPSNQGELAPSGRAGGPGAHELSGSSGQRDATSSEVGEGTEGHDGGEGSESGETGEGEESGEGGEDGGSEENN